ncbi:hypothetical protein FZEAL_5482 [Fusarium zealandicum]|uniref:SET domain-containing protein n=1 Tax=Fusarium zealandicum TaxID=1053134 RepID=A0A8H4UJN4_9HYPO|nr:hypothetical protein FZEAL_5482 [Fusarium zealandicum]
MNTVPARDSAPTSGSRVNQSQQSTGPHSSPQDLESPAQDNAVMPPQNDARSLRSSETAIETFIRPKDASSSMASIETIAQNPAVAPAPLPQNSNAVGVRATRTRRNLGVFANRDFPLGYKIIFERPAISCVHWSMRNGRKNIGDVWTESSEERRFYLCATFASLRNVPCERAISESHKRDLETFIEEYGFWDPPRRMAHVYALTSHINHACIRCANAQQWTDSERPNCITVTLVKPVQQGDEIFIHYNRRRMRFGCGVCGTRKNPDYSEGGGKRFT